MMTSATAAARVEPRTTYFISWETIAVTPLPPGWHNVCRLDGDDLHATPCPAILLQENRGETRAWDEADSSGRVHRRTDFEPAEPPYETRAVFADWEGAHLCPADDAGNYAGTIHPGQAPADLAATP